MWVASEPQTGFVQHGERHGHVHAQQTHSLQWILSCRVGWEFGKGHSSAT